MVDTSERDNVLLKILTTTIVPRPIMSLTKTTSCFVQLKKSCSCRTLSKTQTTNVDSIFKSEQNMTLMMVKHILKQNKMQLMLTLMISKLNKESKMLLLTLANMEKDQSICTLDKTEGFR